MCGLACLKVTSLSLFIHNTGCGILFHCTVDSEFGRKSLKNTFSLYPQKFVISKINESTGFLFTLYTYLNSKCSPQNNISDFILLEVLAYNVLSKHISQKYLKKKKKVTIYSNIINYILLGNCCTCTILFSINIFERSQIGSIILRSVSFFLVITYFQVCFLVSQVNHAF